MKQIITAIIVVLTLSAGVALGQGFPKGSGPFDAYEPIVTNIDDLEVFCQEWTGCYGGWTSQIDNGPEGASLQCADDFVSGTDAAITTAVWWGAQLDGATLPDYFIITIYGALEGDCSHPDTGTVISEQMVLNYNQQDIGAAPFYSYSATLDPVLMDAGRNYWISIRAGLTVIINPDDGTFSTQWFWAMNEQAQECPAVFIGEFFGHSDWTVPTTFDPEYGCGDAFAFCLYTDGAVATEEQSWGSVKTLFR